MTLTKIQTGFAPIKKFLPRWISNPIRSVGTALIGPILFAYRTGYYRSCFKMQAVDKNGSPLPWYTYPCIDFLKFRDYENKTILEFGGGQSTLWWAQRATNVVTLEGDKSWYDTIKGKMPDNVDLCYVSMESREINASQVRDLLKSKSHTTYDVIVIDGLYREEMIDIAKDLVSDDGIIVCDNAEKYGFFEGFKESGLSRVDFFGNTPGVVLSHATSIFFKPNSFVFDSKFPIPVIAKES